MKKKTAKAKPVTALAVRQDVKAENQALAMIERFATNPDFDVEKMRALMDLRDREMRRESERAFHAAMAKAQREMRPVARDADNPATKSRYATYTAMDAALRPIYSANDFGLSFNTGELATPDMVRVICDVSHAGGFSKPYHIDMPADGKGARGNDVMTKTHATGSAVSYGMRYLLKMIFNVAIGEFDDDGNKASAGFNRRMGKTAPPVIDAEPVSSQLENITVREEKRLWDTVDRFKRDKAKVITWLKSAHKVTLTKDLKRDAYDDIIAAIESGDCYVVR